MVSSEPISRISNGISTIEDSTAKWGNLCECLLEMMQNCKEIKKNLINVAIYSIGTKEIQNIYDGLQKTLMTLSENKITISLHDISTKVIDVMNLDFLIMLIQERISGYQAFINEQFVKSFPDKSIKIFLILSNKHSFENLKITWNALGNLKYFNIYVVNHKVTGWFEILRTAINKIEPYQFQPYLKEVKEYKFLMLKDALKGDEFGFFRLVFYDSYPMSYVKDKKIIGADGSLINEFSSKIKTPYLILSNHSTKPSLKDVNICMHNFCDINLCTYATIHSKAIETVWIHQMHGTCLLTPRNIRVSAYENFSCPIDKTSMIMILISTISVIICWRLVTDEMPITSIISAVYGLILNRGASGIDRITLRETFLVYCFIFSSFILMSIYDTVVLSFMFSEVSWRSASSLEELNDSNTMFYKMYDEETALFNNLPRIRQELILHYVNTSGLMSLNVPDKFDDNLVYMVLCEYADYFLQSTRNYQNGRKLYHKIIITPYYKTYNVNKGYLYIKEFVTMVGRLMESGIYCFWKKLDFEAVKENKFEHAAGSKEFNMRFPMFIQVVGCSIALLVFVIELLSNKLCPRNSQQLSAITQQIQCYNTKSKLKLNKWKQKFIFRKRLIDKNKKDTHLSSKCLKSEQIRCRESIHGDYFMCKKFKNLQKSKSSFKKPAGYKFIQVKPYISGSIINLTKRRVTDVRSSP